MKNIKRDLREIEKLVNFEGNPFLSVLLDSKLSWSESDRGEGDYIFACPKTHTVMLHHCDLIEFLYAVARVDLIY